MQLTTSEGCVHAAPQGPGAGLEWAVASPPASRPRTDGKPGTQGCAPAEPSASVPSSCSAVSWYGRLVWEGAVPGRQGQSPRPPLPCPRPGRALLGGAATLGRGPSCLLSSRLLL